MLEKKKKEKEKEKNIEEKKEDREIEVVGAFNPEEYSFSSLDDLRVYHEWPLAVSVHRRQRTGELLNLFFLTFFSRFPSTELEWTEDSFFFSSLFCLF